MTNVQRKTWICVLAAILCICAAILPFMSSHGVAYAANTQYSGILEDLQKDASFDADFYPAYPDEKYSIQVITIAESENNELFVYTYQPSAMTKFVTASSIDISTTIYDGLAFHNYPLELLSRQGVFAKYLVKYLPVEEKNTRYYAITDILRPWDKDIDDPAPGGNTVSEVPFAVAKQWDFQMVNGELDVHVVDIETIEITSKYCGFVRYDAGFVLHMGACDSHFVAFNTDKRIDKLLEADVYYTKQSFDSVITTGYGGVTDYGEKIPCEAHLTNDQSADYKGEGLRGQSFTWKRIQTVQEFKESVEFEKQVYKGGLFNTSYVSKLDDEAKNALNSAKWVLRYYESDWELKVVNPLLTTTEETSTICGDAKILRLKFVTDGKTYNLGVVDNKQSGSPRDPVNDTEYKTEPNDRLNQIWDIIKIILIVTAVIAAVVLIVWLISKVVQMTKSTKVVIKGDVPPNKPRGASRTKSKGLKKHPKQKAKRRKT